MVYLHFLCMPVKKLKMLMGLSLLLNDDEQSELLHHSGSVKKLNNPEHT